MFRPLSPKKELIMKVMSSSSDQAIKIVKWLSLLAVTVLSAVLMVNLAQTRNYVTAKGKLIRLSHDIAYDPDSSGSTERIKKIEIEYNVNGKSYTAEYRTFSFIGKHVGQEVNVHYDANDPQRIRNPFRFEVSIIGILFFSLIFIAMFFIRRG